MRRALVGIFLAAALLFSAASDRAQQPADSLQTNKPQPPSPPAGQQPSQEQQPLRQDQGRITSTVNLVDVLFTVLNRRNKLVPDLEKDNFKIFDDKAPQSIRYFSRQTDLPLRIGLLMDTSNSIRDRLKFEQDAATSFLFNVIRRNRDQAFVMTFDDEPSII